MFRHRRSHVSSSPQIRTSGIAIAHGRKVPAGDMAEMSRNDNHGLICTPSRNPRPRNGGYIALTVPSLSRPLINQKGSGPSFLEWGGLHAPMAGTII